MKKEIQNNYNNIYLLFFIIEVVNIAENMNLSKSYVEENRNHLSCICYIICFTSSESSQNPCQLGGMCFIFPMRGPVFITKVIDIPESPFWK